VGQNSGPIFSRLWTRVHKIKFVRAAASIVCVLRLTLMLLHSGCIRDQVAKLCEIAPKFDVFGPTNFRGDGGKGPPKFLTEFYKSMSPPTMWQSLVTIGQATSEIRRRKKKKRSKLQR